MSYNSAFEELLQEFRDKSGRDTLVVVYRIWAGFENLAENVKDLGECILSDPSLCV
jgi:hypothetical protein